MLWLQRIHRNIPGDHSEREVELFSRFAEGSVVGVAESIMKVIDVYATLSARPHHGGNHSRWPAGTSRYTCSSDVVSVLFLTETNTPSKHVSAGLVEDDLFGILDEVKRHELVPEARDIGHVLQRNGNVLIAV